MKNILSVAAVAAIAAVTSSAVYAATNDTTMGVSATVSRSCTVTADALVFGTIVEGAPTKASSAVAIACTAGSSNDSVTVAFSTGLNPATDQRQMTGGDSTSAVVPYTLAEFDGGPNLTATTGIATTPDAQGTTYSTTVYGSIADSTNYQIGTFSDTVTVTVTYDVEPAV